MGQGHLFQKLRLLDHPVLINDFFQTKHWHIPTIVHPNVDKATDKVAKMEVDKLADMVADMEVDKNPEILVYWAKAV